MKGPLVPLGCLLRRRLAMYELAVGLSERRSRCCQVIVIDEISTVAEVRAVKSIAQVRAQQVRPHVRPSSILQHISKAVLYFAQGRPSGHTRALPSPIPSGCTPVTHTVWMH